MNASSFFELGVREHLVTIHRRGVRHIVVGTDHKFGRDDIRDEVLCRLGLVRRDFLEVGVGKQSLSALISLGDPARRRAPRILRRLSSFICKTANFHEVFCTRSITPPTRGSLLSQVEGDIDCFSADDLRL